MTQSRTHTIEKYVDVEVMVDVDLTDFETEDLLEEISDRNQQPSRETIERLYYATRLINGSGVIPPALTRDIVDLLAALYGRAT